MVNLIKILVSHGSNFPHLGAKSCNVEHCSTLQVFFDTTSAYGKIVHSGKMRSRPYKTQRVTNIFTITEALYDY
jgi:hypothetical protein